MVKDLAQQVSVRLGKPTSPCSKGTAQVSSTGSLLQTSRAQSDCYKGKPLGKASLFQPNRNHQTAMSLAIPLSPAGNLKTKKICLSCTAHLPFWGVLEQWIFALGCINLKEIPLTSAEMSSECCISKTLCKCSSAYKKVALPTAYKYVSELKCFVGHPAPATMWLSPFLYHSTPVCKTEYLVASEYG